MALLKNKENFLLPQKDKPWLEVMHKIKDMNVQTPSDDNPKKEGFDKFWKQMLNDLEFFEKHIHKEKPFDNTCYKKCHGDCLKRFDRTFWNYTLTGYRKHVIISPWKYPGKVIFVALVFMGGLFKMLRAQDDGKASFYGEIITILAQILSMTLLIMDSDYILTFPKMGSIIVSSIILHGIIDNSDGNIGL